MQNKCQILTFYKIIMRKSEILEVVKQMHKDWTNSYKVGFLNFLIENKTDDGFCKYLNSFLNRQFGYEKYLIVKQELFYDLLQNKESIYWYPVLDYFSNYKKSVIQKNLKPRIDHLQRTITRLENEIKSEN